MPDSNTRILENTDSAEHQNRKIFDIYNIYRLVLSLILLISFFFKSLTFNLGSVNPELFIQVIVVYNVFNMLAFFRVLLPQSTGLERSQFVAIILVDIIFLVLISYTCGGVSSGMANLMIVPISTGSLLFRSRLSTFFAAVASILIIYCEAYLYLIIDEGLDYFVQAGLLGFILFAVSGLLQYLGGRIRQNEQLALQQATNIRSLQEMNNHIIMRMHNGILVVDSEGMILTINDAARRFLHKSDGDNDTIILPEVLMEQLQWWQENNKVSLPHFSLSDSSRELQASFSYLNPQESHAPSILIFLEDYTLLTSRAQQMKLMSLGRLTASIAHEVRNPLGAISHASQLLNESPDINSNDQRLLEIIDTHSKRVNSIIENILDLSRNKAEQLERFPIKPWLDQFVSKFSNSQSGEHNIEVVMDAPELEILFNPGQLEQVLTNLCENGLRYSAKLTGTAHIIIKVESSREEGLPVLLVIDDGEGIPESLSQQVFEPFFTTEKSGTGLGLFICREICDANRARLSYNTSHQGKNTFQISFSNPDIR